MGKQNQLRDGPEYNQLGLVKFKVLDFPLCAKQIIVTFLGERGVRLDFLTRVNIILKEHGLEFVLGQEHIGAGFIRFNNRGGRDNGWVILSGDESFAQLSFGDFRTGLSKTEFLGEVNKQKQKEFLEKLASEKETLQKIALEDIKNLWPKFILGLSHPYITKKGLSRLYGARIEVFAGTTTPENIVIPMQEYPTGDIHNLQSISDNGSKSFYPGARVDRVGFWIGSQKPDKIYLCEGYATGCSIYEVLGAPTDSAVFCAMTATNLSPCVQTIRTHFPEARVFILADNDHAKKENAGLDNATKASQAGGSLPIIFPPSEDGVSDFNDYMLKHGKEATKKYIIEKLSSQAVVPKVSAVQKDAKKPNENIVAHLIAQSLEDVAVLEDEIYEYTGTHWKKWEDEDYVCLRKQIRKRSLQYYKTSDVTSCLKAILDELPRCPETLLWPKNTMSNFRNGTLHLIETNKGHHFEFRKHSKEDGLLYVIPFDYSEDLFTAKSEKFEPYVRSLFSQDEDAEDKVNALSEMFGAILMPRYPRLFMLHGESGCGKSTLMLTALRFIRPEDVGSVDPTRFGREFYLEPLVGKMLNAVTDISTTSPISDDIIKQIEDQTPHFINRKGKKAIRAPLPPIHIFGGNGIPKTLDGASRAHERRWTFIQFTKKVAEISEMDKNYARWLFESDAKGILGFALRGLTRLIKQKGIYTQPNSGKKTMSEWQIEADCVGQFLEDVKNGEVDRVYLTPGGKIKASDLWEAFKIWKESTNSMGAKHMSKPSFYTRLAKHGKCKLPRTNEGYFFEGFTTDKKQAHPF